MTIDSQIIHIYTSFGEMLDLTADVFSFYNIYTRTTTHLYLLASSYLVKWPANPVEARVCESRVLSEALDHADLRVRDALAAASHDHGRFGRSVYTINK